MLDRLRAVPAWSLHAFDLVCCCLCRCSWSELLAAACAASQQTLTATLCGRGMRQGAWLSSGRHALLVGVWGPVTC
jgi:hypothetical protein